MLPAQESQVPRRTRRGIQLLLQAGRASTKRLHIPSGMRAAALADNLVRKRKRTEVTGWRCNKVCAASWVHSCRSQASDRSAAPTPVLVCLFLRAAPSSPCPLGPRGVRYGLSGPQVHYPRSRYHPGIARGSTCISGVVLGINCCPPDPAPSRRCLLRLQRELGLRSRGVPSAGALADLARLLQNELVSRTAEPNRRQTPPRPPEHADRRARRGVRRAHRLSAVRLASH